MMWQLFSSHASTAHINKLNQLWCLHLLTFCLFSSNKTEHTLHQGNQTIPFSSLQKPLILLCLTYWPGRRGRGGQTTSCDFQCNRHCYLLFCFTWLQREPSICGLQESHLQTYIIIPLQRKTTQTNVNPSTIYILMLIFIWGINVVLLQKPIKPPYSAHLSVYWHNIRLVLHCCTENKMIQPRGHRIDCLLYSSDGDVFFLAFKAKK